MHVPPHDDALRPARAASVPPGVPSRHHRPAPEPSITKPSITKRSITKPLICKEPPGGDTALALRPCAPRDAAGHAPGDAADMPGRAA